MDRLAPVGDVYQAGTLSGNPLATAAGLSVLRRLRDQAVYEELEATGARLEAGLRDVRPRPARRRDGDPLPDGRRPSATSRPPGAATPSATARSSATCSSAGSTSRRRSSSACSSRSRTADEEIDRTVEAVARLLRQLTCWERSPAERPRESPLWAEALRAEPERGAGLLAARRRSVRARRRDDLRGLPRPLRPPAALRARRPGHGAPARRLPLRARARPHRRDGGRRRGRRDLAELISRCAALRAEGDGAATASRAGSASRRGALGGEPEPAARALDGTRRSRAVERALRARVGCARVAPDARPRLPRRRRRRRASTSSSGC